jgi:hypothetical protein
LDRRQRASDLLYDSLKAVSAERVTLADIVAAFDTRGFGFLLLVFALPNCVPTPPGIGALFGLPLGFIACQLMINRHRPWLPNWLLRRDLDRAALMSTIERSRRGIRRFEALFKPRLEGLFDAIPEWLLGAFLLLLAISIIIPFPLTNFVPAIGSAVIGLALIERDGLALLFGFAIGIAGLALSIFVIGGAWVVTLEAIHQFIA